MSEKLLSVSIASYNTETTLGETVHSLFIDKRWMEKLEIIIVNDGSKDNTSDIAHDLEQKYPDSIIVIDKENGGYGSTINSSLSIASGKFFKLLDGDDWFNTEEIPAFLDYLDKMDADIVVSPYVEVRAGRKLIDAHQEIPEKPVDFDSLKLENNLFVMHEITVKTQVLKDQHRKIAEHCFYTDSEYVFYCIIGAKSVARYHSAIYLYRLGVEGQSVSLEGIRKHQKDLPIVMNRIVNCHALDGTKIQGARKGVLDLSVCNITYHTYRSFMLLKEAKRYKEELLSLDLALKREYISEYLIGNRSRFVKLARMTRFIPYGLLCNIAVNKFIMETKTN